MRRFMDQLETSRNTITRDFEYLRDTLGAPIVYCREQNGHQYDPAAPVFELPGFWMNASELYALLACEQLLETVQPGLVTQRLAPLRARIQNLLGESGHDARRISERVKIQATQKRHANHQVFDPVAEATLKGRQLNFRYAGRSADIENARTASPQKLIHYRSNWYLLALCHKAQALRLFSLDRIRHPEALEASAMEVSETELNLYTSSGFGIFGGVSRGIAHLRFSDEVARWVADEQWHPDQTSEWCKDGYHLKMPFSDSRELVMEVLRYGADVEVLAPEELRETVAARIQKMGAIY
jgi:predicted DNA-binding transcriptional regulator YafY